MPRIDTITIGIDGMYHDYFILEWSYFLVALRTCPLVNAAKRYA